MMKVLETQHPVPRPLALVLNYPALDFNFTSWMSPNNLRVLRSEQSSGQIDALVEQKDHLRGTSPLSMVRKRPVVRRRRSWRDAIRNLTSHKADGSLLISRGRSPFSSKHVPQDSIGSTDDATDTELEDETDFYTAAPSEETREEDLPLSARVRFDPQVHQVPIEKQQHHNGSPYMNGYAAGNGNTTGNGHAKGSDHSPVKESVPLGTRLTMTSRSGYFQDRIISPSMVCLIIT